MCSPHHQDQPFLSFVLDFDPSTDPDHPHPAAVHIFTAIEFFFGCWREVTWWWWERGAISTPMMMYLSWSWTNGKWPKSSLHTYLFFGRFSSFHDDREYNPHILETTFPRRCAGQDVVVAIMVRKSLSSWSSTTTTTCDTHTTTFVFVGKRNHNHTVSNGLLYHRTIVVDTFYASSGWTWMWWYNRLAKTGFTQYLKALSIADRNINVSAFRILDNTKISRVSLTRIMVVARIFGARLLCCVRVEHSRVRTNRKIRA